MDNAIDTAARFGEIPFVAFTKELVTGVFDSLVESHLLQMEEYATFVNSMTQDLTTYINNTQDGVTFDQISDFLLSYELPAIDNTALNLLIGKLQSPPNPNDKPAISTPATATDAEKTEGKWWNGLINALAPVVGNLVDKIKDPNKVEGLKAFADYNNAILSNASSLPIPKYTEIRNSVAALICSNKYSLLQTMVKQGMMRLVVTEGEIETKITFSTWNNSVSGSEESNSVKTKNKSASNNFSGGGILGIFKGKRSFSRDVNKVLTVNTAKSYQRDSSGTRVDIFGRVLIKFKTDYLPLNGF
jgi:hypothetical protein